MGDRKPSRRHILLTIAIIYGLFCLFVFVVQRSLLYHPTRISASVVESEAREHGFEPWKNAAGQIIGWKIAASNSPSSGSVLIMHGNAGCALNRDYLAQPIHDAANLDVYVLEYPGYGARDGSPSKSSLVAAAEEAFQLLPAGRPRYVVGESIGTGPACEVAKRHTAEVTGMVLFVPYDNLASVAQRHFPFLPAYILLLDRYNPAECLKNYPGPVQFVVAGADEILGPGTGRKLYNGYQGRKNLQEIPNAGHNEVSSQPADWWRGVLKFWQNNGKP